MMVIQRPLYKLIKATGVVSLALAMICGLLLVFNTLTPAANAAPLNTAVSGPIATNTIWGLAGSPYTVSGVVNVSAQLVIQPGVEVRFLDTTPGSRLEFDNGGQLLAIGTPAQPIIFTSDRATPARNDWDGIFFGSNAVPSTIQYAVIEYANQGVNMDSGVQHTILSNTFRHIGVIGSDGAIVGTPDQNTTIRYNQIYSSWKGIDVDEVGNLDILNNHIYDIDTTCLRISSAGASSFFNEVRNNNIHDCGGRGIWFEGVGSSYGTYSFVTGNTVWNTAQEGVVVANQLDFELEDNTVYSTALSSTAAAVSVLNAEILIQNNNVFGNGTGSGPYAGVFNILITDSTRTLPVDIINNQIRDDYGSGLIFDGSIQGHTINSNAICVAGQYEMENRDGFVLARGNWLGTNIPAAGTEITGTVDITPFIQLGTGAAPTIVPADGLSAAVITVTMHDGLGHTVPVGARQINLTTNLGTLANPTVTLDGTGTAVTQLTSTSSGTATITVTEGCGYVVTTTVVFQATDVEISKSTAVTQITPGQTITYTIPYTNNATVAATNVVITDTLPAGVQWLTDTAASEGFARNQTSPDVVWTRPSLPGGAAGTITLVGLLPRTAIASCGATLTNSVVITTATVETNITNNSGSAGGVQVLCADVAVRKSTALTQVVPGQTVTYTIAYSNSGTAPAQNIIITDTLPVNVVWLTDTAVSAGFTRQQTATAVGWSRPSLAVGQNGIITLVGQAQPAIGCGTVLTNSVTITSTSFDANLGNQTDSNSAIAVVCADVIINKVGPAGTILAGETITYTLTYSNIGTAPAANVVITDVNPITGGIDTLVSGITLAPGQYGSVDYPVVVDPAVCAANPAVSITNTGTIGTGTPESNESNNSSSFSNNVQCLPDLVITKTRVSTASSLGRPITFTLEYRNSGVYTAPNTVLTDTLPAGVIYLADTSGLTPVTGTGTVVWNLGDVGPGDSGVFEVAMVADTVVCTTSVMYLNQASIGSAWPDADPSNNIDTAASNVIPCDNVDLVVNKNDGVGGPTQRPFVWAGDVITYTITYLNVGGLDAHGVVLTETLPAHTTFIGQPGWTRVGTTSQYIYNLGTVPSMNGDRVYFVVRVNPGLPFTVTVVNNEIWIGGNEPDNVPGDNVSYEQTPVHATADLDVQKAGLTPVAHPGGPVTYAITVTNQGSVTATNVVVADILPAGTSYVTNTLIGAPVSMVGNTIAWDVGQLGPGQTLRFDLTLLVDSGTGLCTTIFLTNTVGAQTDTPEGDTSNNTASTTASSSPVIACRDVEITKTVDDPQTSLDRDVVFTLEYGNPALITATNVVVTDTLPTGLTFVGSNPSYSGSLLQEYQWNLPDLPPGITNTIVITAHTTVDFGFCGATLTNTAEITASFTGGVDEYPGNNLSETAVSIRCVPDLVIVKNDRIGAPWEPPFVQVGDVFTYSIIYSNIGIGPASNVVITETLPANTAFRGPAGWTQVGSTNLYTYNVGTVAQGAGVQVEFAVQVNSYPLSGFITNTVCIGTTDDEGPFTNNNCSGDQTLVTQNRPRLNVSKSAIPAGGSNVLPGDTITYTVVVLNDGAAAASNIRITDTLPLTEVSFVTATLSNGSPVYGPNPLTATVSSLPVNSAVTMTVTVLVNNVISGTLITNTAQASADTLSVQQSLPVTHVVESLPVITTNLAITKTGQVPTVTVGNPATYDITVTNRSSVTATNVRITDTMPSGSGYLSDTSGLTATVNLNMVSWDVGQLDPGETYTFSLILSTNQTACVFRPLTNTITVGSAEVDIDLADNTDTATTGIFCNDLYLTKVVNTPLTTPDQDVVFTLTYNNPGLVTATNVVVSDTLPAGITFVNSTPPPSNGPVDRAYLWNLNNVSPGITGTIVITGHVGAGVACNSVLTNTAIITTTATDENPLNNTDTASVTVLCGVDMSLVKNDGVGGPTESPFVQVDDVITYSLSYNNLGTGPGNNVVITETLPAHTSFVGPTGANGWVLAGGNQYTYTLNTVNAGNGGVVNFVVRVAMIPPGGFITNTACIGSSDIDVVPGNNCTFEQTQVTTNTPRLQVVKNAVPAGGSAVQPGQVITYTVVVLNNGLATANNVRITDTLPLTEVSFITATLSNGHQVYGPNPLTTTVVTLPVNNAITMTVVVSVNNVLTGTVFTNTAQAIANSLPVQMSLPVTHVVTSTVPATSTLSITKTAVPPSGSWVEPGNRITYTVVVANNGTSPVNNVVVSDTLNANVTLATSNTTTGTLSGPNPVRLSLPTLGAGQRVTMTLGVTVSGSFSGTLISNQATVSSTQTPLPLASGVVTHVISSSLVLPNFTVTKSANPSSGTPVDPGDTITYTVVAVNNGGPATGVVLTDTIPTGTAFVPGSASTNLGGVTYNGSAVVVNAPNFPAGFSMTTTFRVTVTTNFTTTITNTARLINAQTPLTSSNPVTHPVRGTQLAHVYLPIIFKNFTPRSAALSWINQSEDRVSEVDGSNPQAFVADGRNDGAFMLTVSTGSEGPKTVANVRLVSSQGASAQWDTIINTVPVLGVFNGGTRLNNADGTVSQTINGQIIVALYASDNQTQPRFPPDTYDYTVIVTFTDGTSVSATARIPAPPPPVCYINKVADITVGNDPRGVVVDEGRSRAYVANFGSNSVSVVDTGSNTVITTVTGITTANGITLDPDRNIVWVTNYSANRVTPINANTGVALAPVAVGSGPWGVAYVNGRVYVVNNLGNSVTVIDAASRAVVDTVSGSFNRPYHIAANPNTRKLYVPNFGNHTVTVINDTTTTVSSVINLNVGDPSTQPYGVAVDETRNVVYVATVDSHRVVAIGTLNGVPDQLLGWAAFHRGYFNPVPHRPVPMRAIAVNPDIGPISPMDDGGHVWTTTSTGDGSEANQTLLIPKGWSGYFHSPLPCDVGINPTEGIAIHRGLDRAYVTSGSSPGTLTVFNDNPTPPLVPFSASESSDPITFEIFKVE